MTRGTVWGIGIMLAWCAAMAALIFLFGCLHAPTLPKVVTIHYQDASGQRMSLICVHETRADYRPDSYECDTGEVK